MPKLIGSKGEEFAMPCFAMLLTIATTSTGVVGLAIDYIASVDGTPMTTNATIDVFLGHDTTAYFELANPTDSLDLSFLPNEVISGTTSVACVAGGSLIGSVTGRGTIVFTSGLVLGLPENSIFKLCTVDGNETNLFVRVLPPISSSMSVSELTLPSSDQFGSWSVDVPISSLPTALATGSSSRVYFAPVGSSCSIDSRITAVSPPTSTSLVISINNTIAALLVGTISELCFQGSALLGVTVLAVDAFAFAGTSQLSTSREFGVYLNSAVSFDLSYTIDALSGVSLAGYCYACDGTSTAAVSSSTSSIMPTTVTRKPSVSQSVAVTALQSTQFRLCFAFTTSLNVSLNVLITPFSISSIAGIAAQSSTTHVPILISSTTRSSVVWEVAVSSGGTIAGGIVAYLSEASTCATATAHATAPLSTSMTLPTDWYSSVVQKLFLCARHESGMYHFTVSPFALQVMRITDVVRAPLAVGSTDGTLKLLLPSDDALVLATGTIYDDSQSAIFIGMYDSSSGNCLYGGQVNSVTGYAFLFHSKFTSAAGSICARVSSSASMIIIASYTIQSVDSIGNYGVTSVFGSAKAQPIAVAFSLTDVELMKSVTFYAATSCRVSSSTKSVSFDAAFTEFYVTVSSPGTYALCWRFTETYFTTELFHAATQFTVLPAPLESNSSGFFTLNHNASIFFADSIGAYMNGSAIFSAAVQVHTSGASFAPCTGAMTSVAQIALSASTGAQFDVPLVSPSSPSMLYLCGLLVGSSNTSALADPQSHPIHLGNVQFIQIQLNTAPIPPSTPSTTIIFPLSGATISASFALAYTLEFDAVIDIAVHASDCSKTVDPFLSGSSWGMASTGFATVNVTALQRSGSVGEVILLLCGRVTGSSTQYRSLQQSAAAVSITSIDSREIRFGESAIRGMPVVVAVLSSCARDLPIGGSNLHLPSLRTLQLHTTEINASCANAATHTLTMQESIHSSATISFAGQSSVTYTLVCVGLVDALTGYTFTIETNFVVVVLPVQAFQRPLATGKQQTSIVGAARTNTNVTLVLESGYQLSSSDFTFFATNGTSCNNTTTTDGNSEGEHPLSYTSSSLGVDATSLTSGRYALCAMLRSSFAARFKSTGDVAASTSISLIIVSFAVAGAELNSGAVIGATVREPIDLRITGTYLGDVFLFISATDSSVPCGQQLGEPNLYGNSRTPALASGCGSTVAAATLDAATSKTAVGNEMHMCFALSPAADPAPSDSTSVTLFDAGIFLAVTEPTELMIMKQISSVSNGDGSFTQQPTLALRDADSQAVLASIPSSIFVKATWFVIFPFVAEANQATYDFRATKGDSIVDFAAQNPIFLKQAAHGYVYMVAFTAVGDATLMGTNSTEVRRGDCSTTELAEIYTTNCISCPADGSCNGSSVFNVTDSLWRPHIYSMITYSCKFPFASLTCLANTPTGTCRDGHSGPRCTVCTPGYAWATDQCAECGARWRSGLVVAGVVLIFFGFVGALILSTLQCRKGDLFPIYLKVLINHLTVASTVGTFAANLPVAATKLFQIQKTASKPTADFAALSCLTGFNWYQKFLATNLIPVAFALLVSIALCFRRKPPEKKAADEEDREHTKKEEKDGEDSGNGDDNGKTPTANVTVADDELLHSVDASDEVEKSNSANDDRKEPAPVGDADADDAAATVRKTANERWRKVALMGKFMHQLERQQSLGMLEIHGIVRRQRSIHIFAVCMVVVLFFTYPSLVESCANVLKCDRIDHSYVNPFGQIVPDVRSYFYYDRSKLCDSQEHKMYIIAALILGLWWGVGTPLLAILLFYFLRRPVTRGGIGKGTASRMFTFLVAGYRRHVWWWEAVFMFRKFLAIYIVEFVWDLRLQSLLAFWAMALFLALHVVVCPFDYETPDRMERNSLIVICLTLTLSQLYEWAPLDHPDTVRVLCGYLLTALLLALNVGIVLWMLKLLIAEGITKVRKFIAANKKPIKEHAPECCVGCLLSLAYVRPRNIVVDEEYSGAGIQRKHSFRSESFIAEVKRNNNSNKSTSESDSDWSDDDNACIGPQSAATDHPSDAVDIHQQHSVSVDPAAPTSEKRKKFLAAKEASARRMVSNRPVLERLSHLNDLELNREDNDEAPAMQFASYAGPRAAATAYPPHPEANSTTQNDPWCEAQLPHFSNEEALNRHMAQYSATALWPLDTSDAVVLTPPDEDDGLITLASGQAIPSGAVRSLLVSDMGEELVDGAIKFTRSQLHPSSHGAGNRPSRAEMHRRLNIFLGARFERHAISIMQLAQCKL